MQAVPPVTKASCITKLFSRFFVSFGGQKEAIVTFKGAEKIEKKIRPDVCHDLRLVMTHLILSVAQNLLISSSFNSYFSTYIIF